MWLKSEGFLDQVKLWWQSYKFHGCPSYVLACKLKALKVDLRKWNEEVFGHVGQRKKVLLDGIQEFGIIGEGRALTEEERVIKDDFSRELERLLLCEEVSWRQKSRALWLRERNKNTKFFHRVANSNRRNNTIEYLTVNRSLSLDATAIKAHIVQFFYTQLYSEQSSWRPKPDGLSFHSIGADEGSWLEREFEESEVFEVVQVMNGDKAPDPMIFLWVLLNHVGKFLKRILWLFSDNFTENGVLRKV
jgi:hypothetical protein